MKTNTVLQLAVIMAITVFICACSDPRNTTLPPDVSTWKSDQKITKSIEKLPEDEKKLLAAYAMRATISGAFGGEGIKTGITVGEAIDIQQKWQEEQQKEKEKQRLLAEELQRKQLGSLEEMNDSLTVSLLNLSFHASNMQANQYQDIFSIKIGFRNNTDVNMSGAKGIVILKDMFGEIIKKINLSNDSGIIANESMIWSGTMNYNQFMASDKKLRTTEFEKIQFEWMPDIYLFEDGKKLTMPKM